MCGLLDESDIREEGRHWELHQSHIKKNEAAVLKVISTIQSFLSSWRVSDKNRLYSLAPELPVSIDVENDVLGAEDLGQSIKEEWSTLCEKCPNTELFLLRIFLYLDWIRRGRISPYSVRIQEIPEISPYLDTSCSAIDSKLVPV